MKLNLNIWNSYLCNGDYGPDNYPVGNQYNIILAFIVATNLLIEDLETVTTGDSILQKVKEDAQKWFNTVKQKSSANGIRLKTGLVISPTDIEVAIVDYAERESVELIVIGGGKSGLKQRLLGSTTSHVATQTKHPHINSEVSCKKKDKMILANFFKP